MMPAPRPPRPRREPSKPRRPAKSSRPPEPEAPKQWGSLARKGVGRMRDDRPFKAAEAFRDAAPAERRVEEWVRTDVRDEAEHAVTRAKKTPRRERSRAPAPDVAAELDKAVGARTAVQLGKRLA